MTSILDRIGTVPVDERDRIRDQEDPNLPAPLVSWDPRILNPAEKGKAQKKRGQGRNTESFDPKSTLVRPSMRILVGPNRPVLNKTITHDDVIIVPEFFCKEDDWSLYYQLIEEMRASQSAKEKNSEWISWHEGAHLISKNPTGCPAFQSIQDRIAAYFEIEQKSVGTRFNWYTNSNDWKVSQRIIGCIQCLSNLTFFYCYQPFHHDSAAFNPQRARNQNITVGVSFGATRELAFLNAKSGEKIYFPQTNGMLFSFGRDVNILWKHGINALSEENKDEKGRVSIILWGQAPRVKEEGGSPPMLTDEARGAGGYSMHANRHDGRKSDGRAPAGRRDDSRDRGRRRSRSRSRSRDRYRDSGDRDRQRYDGRDDRARPVDRDRQRVDDRDRQRSSYDDRYYGR